MNTITINKNYCHLSAQEREKIGLLLNQGITKKEISLLLNRHISTIYRELSRNSISNKRERKLAMHNGQTYIPSNAHKISKRRMKVAHKRIRLNNPELQKYIKQHLEHFHWSPAMIAARWNRENLTQKTNYESIYQWINADCQYFTKFLPLQRPVRKKRAALRKRRNVISDKIFIDQRPESVNSRIDFGNYEADTVVSSDNKSAVAVLVERKSRFYFVKNLFGKTSMKMHNALVDILKPLPQQARKSITYDQGPENVLHKLTNQVLNTNSYFCYPYHSWEKGSIENRNKILRRFFPKKTNWTLLSEADIDNAVTIINNMPLKCLDWLTPHEVFHNELLNFRT